VPINFGCPGCGKTLRVGDENAGKLARCPDCGAVATIPAASAGESPPPGSAAPLASFPTSQPSSTPASNFGGPAPNPPSARDSNPSLRETALHPGSNSGVNSASWLMRTENGKSYGPVTKSTLDDWYQQGRIASFHFLSSDHGQSWLAAPDVYPQLRQTSAGFQPSSPGASAAGVKRSDNPFSDSPSHAYSPYAAPQSAMGPTNYGLPAGQGGLLLTLAILGFACCPVFSLVSLILGIRELNEVNAGRLRPEAKGLAMASVIISAIALVLWVGGVGIGIIQDL
jgi:hypothetical protein